MVGGGGGEVNVVSWLNCELLLFDAILFLRDGFQRYDAIIIIRGKRLC